ncbi:MAG TPA: restriction endonuclease subunit S [Chthoniobacteraceae bacterium]|nr:restriction endonuclease subunit S [Chthoniobacteraceae bacterium]
MGERKLRPLGEICEFRGGQGFPQKHQGVTVGEYPFIKVSDMELPANRYRITSANHWIDEATRKQLRAKLHPATSTVFAKIGVALTYNRRRLLSRPTIVDNNMMAAVPKESEVDSLFLYYLLKATDFNKVVSGTALPYINGSDLAKMEVEVPPLLEQKAIAAVLGGLDEKIELNRRMNATLEAMARALFQSWFVDFDPVRAKQEGRTPSGLDESTAALFPAQFQDSELGQIPQGWDIARLDDIATITMGLSPAGDSYNADGIGIPLINGPVEFGDYFPVKTKWSVAATRFAADGDLIFCVRGSTTGRRVIADGEYCIGRGVCAIRAKNGLNGFLYQTINVDLDRLLQKTTGSVFPNLSAPDIKGFKVLKPSNEILGVYERITKPFIRRIQQNHYQSRTLISLRDALLPKLLSGSLRVP